ncbi:MAG: phosphatidylinositol 4-kinase alpha-like, partial [Trebouxia sp. A1-2]
MTLASAAIKEAQVAFAACVSAQPVMLPDLVSRIRSLLLSSARLTEGELLRHTDDIGPATAQTAPGRVWRWDLTTDAVPTGTGPEAACSLLAASWRSGDQAGVKAAFLPLSDVEGFSALASTANERQAVLLTVGRLCCVLHGSKSHRHSAASEELARMALTLLLDTLGSEDVSLSQVDACAVYTLACLGVSYGLQDCRLDNVGLDVRKENVWDLGALLPAIASLSQGLPATHAIGKRKTHSNSFDILQVIQEDDANRIKMFRLLWLYSALYDLTGIGARGPKYPFPEPWRLGLGQIALASPFAVVGGGSETTEKLEAEFGERLLRLGPKATASTLAALLAETVSGSATMAHPSSAARTAHVLIIAALNLVRVEVAPLPRPHDLPPLAFLLAQQQVLGSDNADGPWLKAITERVMNIYCERLSGYAWSGNPDLALLADRLLHSMLLRFPQLLWSAPVMQALLVELQREEGALYLNGAKPRLTLARVLRIRRKKKKVPLPAWTWIIRIVQEGAALAPGWTEAMFHELLDQEASPASGAALHHAADIMSLHDTAKAQHCMAGMQQTISGVQALNRKARYRGIVAGCQTLDEAKDFPSPVGGLTQIAAALQHAIASKAPAKVLQDRYLQATAALIQQAGSSMQPKLLHLIAWLPAHRFGTFSMSLAVFAWHWILAESPDLQVPLMSEIVQAWLYTSDNNMGIFDCHFDAKAFIDGTITDAEAAAHCDDNASSASPAPYGDILVPISQVDDITAHHIWVGFFLQTWQVMSYGASAESAAITTIFTRMLQHSLKDSHGLSQHPAATGTRFRLLLLALQHCRQTQQHQRYQHGQICPPHIAVLFERIMATALAAFRAPPAWYGKWHKNQAREQAAAVNDFRQEVQNMPFWPTLPRNTSASGGPALIHPVWGSSTADNRQRQELLLLLLRSEAERLTVWASPRDVLDADNRIHLSQTSDQDWGRHLLTAWDCDQRLALCLLEHYPAISAVRRELEALVLQHADDPALQELPEAALLLATPGAVSRNAPQLTNLAVWAAMALMAGPAGAQPAVRAYCIRSLQATKPEEVAFFLPQLVQLLRGDSNGMIQHFLFTAAGRSNVFAYNLVCILKSEATPGEDEMNPTVKRSGWHAPEDTGLWAIADRVWEHLPNDRELFLKAEQAFFDEVTQVSGKLFPFPKDERKAQAVKILKGIHLPRKDLYLPTNPESRVMSLVPESGQPMQSAAKVPLLVKFKVEESLGLGRPPETRLQACIFKVGDDCRQDVLALQVDALVIGLLKDAFQKAGLDLYLAPYGVLPTAYECGIIEVVPEASSRSALGETSDAGLYEIFQREFGAPGTESFEIARHNFILSSAGYAIASYLLQSKDRHNGNILIDTQGRLVHIDFGFILEISPGANMRFESAAFKLSHEMTQLLDPSGQRDSSQFHLFEELCVRGFLAARSVAEGIVATVALMQESRLPCFGRGAPIPNLRKRFHLDMTEAKAAAFMRSTILDAYDKWTTGVYDFIQYMQNAIPK